MEFVLTHAEYRIGQEQYKLIQHAEDIALTLDEAIQAGEILDDDIQKIQARFDKICEALEGYEELLGDRFYIIYEIRGLLSWINKDESKAQNFLKTAAKVSGNNGLLTKSAKDLLGSTIVAAKPRKPVNKKRLLFWLIVLALMLFWTPITDYWTIATADKVMVDLADRANMSFKGKAAFLRMDPEFVSDAEMAVACGPGVSTNNSNGYIEQGCYGQGKIYIRDMPSDLDDMEIVTAAHELLHPVYDEITKSDGGTSTLDALVESDFKLNNDDSLSSRIANYAETEPGYREQELFSILGTEYSNISSDLMAYYSPYFNDNLVAVVNANTNIANIFKSDENELAAIKADIQKYSDLANQELESANYAYYCSTTWARAGNSYENNRNYNIYLARFKVYEGYIEKQNDKVDEYNNLLAQYNILVTEYNGTQILSDIPAAQVQSAN